MQDPKPCTAYSKVYNCCPFPLLHFFLLSADWKWMGMENRCSRISKFKNYIYTHIYITSGEKERKKNVSWNSPGDGDNEEEEEGGASSRSID